jgi:hypothetical protein
MGSIEHLLKKVPWGHGLPIVGVLVSFLVLYQRFAVFRYHGGGLREIPYLLKQPSFFLPLVVYIVSMVFLFRYLMREEKGLKAEGPVPLKRGRRPRPKARRAKPAPRRTSKKGKGR